MAKGRELKGRIRSVQNTRKITKTMELVATSKLKRAQDRVLAARPFDGLQVGARDGQRLKPRVGSAPRRPGIRLAISRTRPRS